MRHTSRAGRAFAMYLRDDGGDWLTIDDGGSTMSGQMGDRRASQRAKGELERAIDIRLGRAASLVAGVLIGLAAMAVRGALDVAVQGDAGYIPLMAATVVAAWVGGISGGLSATLFVLVMNSVFIIPPQGVPSIGDRVELTRQILFGTIGVGTILVIGSRRASRDRLADALDEVAELANEIELRDDRLELTLAASRTGFWEWDMIGGGLVWSDAIFNQHGLDPSGPPPSFPAYLDTIHPDDRETFESALAAAIADGEMFDHDFRIVWPDGSVHRTHGVARTFRDWAGRPIRMLGTGQDITERYRLESERDALVAAERRAGEFRDAFVDVISHKLRTPITTILGTTELLARRDVRRDDATVDSMFDDMRSEAARLHRLVEDLLVLSRAERGHLVADVEPVVPLRLVEQTVAKAQQEMPTIRIDLVADDDLPIVLCEVSYVEQVLHNLLGNAAKYTPPGTRVTVGLRREGDMVGFRVCDSGPGIPAGSEERLFELFYRDPTAATEAAGSGIGLFVCARLVEAMGGQIWAARRPEGGSEFGFRLRLLEHDPADGA